MSDLNTVIGKLDDVITRITKSKRVTSVRILNEVRTDLLQNGIPTGSYDAPQSSVNAPVASPVIPAGSKERLNGKTPYVAQDGEVEKALFYIKAGKNVVFEGPTGCGKTHLVDHIANLLGKTYETIQGEEGARKEDILGYPNIQNGSMGYTYGVLPRTMMKENSFIYWDEPNMTPAGIQSICYRPMDHRRELWLPDCEGGKVIKATAGFVFISAMNVGKGYRGTVQESHAKRARYGGIITLDYLPEARERKMLVARTGVDPTVAEKMSACAKLLRASFARKGDGIQTPVSTRSLLAACEVIALGMNVHDAIECSLINLVDGTQPTERKAFADIFEAKFGRKGAK